MDKEKIKILAIVGSASEKSSNEELLKAIQKNFDDEYEIEIFNRLRDFPLFRPEDLNQDLDHLIKEFKQKLNGVNRVIICTPEYTHNIPAVLKNGLEWITASGELNTKKVLPITFTPHEPRGEWAMQSLLFCLKTMNAQIVTKLPLYKNDFKFNGYQILLSDDNKTLISEALKLLG